MVEDLAGAILVLGGKGKVEVHVHIVGADTCMDEVAAGAAVRDVHTELLRTAEAAWCTVGVAVRDVDVAVSVKPGGEPAADILHRAVEASEHLAFDSFEFASAAFDVYYQQILQLKVVQHPPS